MHQEAIELGFGQGIGTLLFQRVLGRHDEKDIRQQIGLAADRDLPFGHGFEQCRLHLGRGAIDFIGQNQIVEQRSALELKAGVLGTIDFGTGEIGRQQIRGKLNAVKTPLNTVTEHLDGARLGQTRSTLYEQVSVRKNGHQQALDQSLLADNPGAHGRLQIQYFLL